MEKNRGSAFFQKIVFQNVAINIVMLIAFVAVILVMKNSMKGMVSTATTASTNEANLLIQMGEMKVAMGTLNGDMKLVRRD